MTRCTKNTVKLSVSNLSDEERKGFVNAYFASESNLSDFARTHGLNYKTFYTWVKKFGTDKQLMGKESPVTAPSVTTPPLFAELAVPVSVESSNRSWLCEIDLGNNLTLRIGCDVEVDTVAQLLQSLRKGGPAC